MPAPTPAPTLTLSFFQETAMLDVETSKPKKK